MRIESIDGGFTEIIENGIVEKVICLYDGTCTIYFYDKPPKKLSLGCSSYHSQYGIPVSIDGRKLFIGNWEKEAGGYDKGLHAYDIETESLLWRLGEGKIRQIYVYENYLIVLKAYDSIYKIDIHSGTVLWQIKSGTIENAYDLGYPNVLVDAVKEKLCVLNVEKMSIVKKYGTIYNSKIINPSNSISLVITDASVQGNELTISGFESDQKQFRRIIDADFHSS